MSDQKKILVVDDREEDRDLLTEILEDENFIVRTENDGSSAIATLQSGEFAPDLILMDMSMEGMSGHTAFNIIKSDEALCEIPFIFVTGKEKTQDLFESQKADDFIIKPYDPDNLVARVKKVIENKGS